jgi:hypothetical protein
LSGHEMDDQARTIATGLSRDHRDQPDRRPSAGGPKAAPGPHRRDCPARPRARQPTQRSAPPT